MGQELDSLPGFRRRFRVTPGASQITAALEDDIHCMAVTLHHDGATIQTVAPDMDRVPWTLCPGAREVLRKTFEGVALADAARRGDKALNCTHLYDLAQIAAAHAGDFAPFCYNIAVADPVEGVVRAEIRRDGVLVCQLSHKDDVLLSPAAVEGLSLFNMRDWIRSLQGVEQEAARLLQWVMIIAHGRTLPMERQNDATRMPPNCYTFQPVRKAEATRVGRVLDFSGGALSPLDHFDGQAFTPRG